MVSRMSLPGTHKRKVPRRLGMVAQCADHYWDLLFGSQNCLPSGNTTICHLAWLWLKKGKSHLASGSFSQEVEPGYLKELALHAMSCYAYDEQAVFPPTVRRRDPIFLVRISFSALTLIRQRRCLTMLGDRLPIRKLLGFLGQCRA